MFELIPSDFMRDLFEKKGFIFSDFQKATLIWNMPDKNWEQKIAALKELAAATEDEILKKQIWDRITYEVMALRKFKDNANGRYVYVVEENDTYSSDCGFFAEYNLALEYLKKYSKENEVSCTLKKQFIVKYEEELRVKRRCRMNPNIFKDVQTVEYEDYDGLESARIYFEMDGQIRDIWSDEMTEEQEQEVDAFRKERFEYHFMKIPFEGKKGTIVKDGTETYGVLMTDTRDWEDYMQRIEDQNLYVDFSDVQVMVYCLTEQGIWVHEHVNPLYLEVERYPWHEGDRKSEAYWQAMESFSDYWKETVLTGEEDLQRWYGVRAIACAKEYRDICLQSRMEEEKQKNKRVDRAETIDDIII